MKTKAVRFAMGRRSRAAAGVFALIMLAVPAYVVCPRAAASDGSEMPPALKSAPANHWVLLHDFPESGARAEAAFFYAPNIHKFVLAGGAPGGSYGQSPRHYDNEEFDLATASWINAYPPGAPDSYTPATGVTLAPDTLRDDAARTFRTDKAGFLRVPWWYSYGEGSGAYFQFAYDTDSLKLLAYVRNETVIYDPSTRLWTQTAAAPFSHGSVMHWGSFCYDPVNHEILSIGGTSDEAGGTPGTWLYSVRDGKWVKPLLGSDTLRTVDGLIRSMHRSGEALVGACRNRYHVTESSAEATAKIGLQAEELIRLGTAICGKLDAFQSTDPQGARARSASIILRKACTDLGELKPALDRPMTAETIAAAQGVDDEVQHAMDSVAIEPPARALSQMAYDGRAKKIVLFGGDGLDRHLADTWVYDCATRTWEQRYPKLSPSPRAGHALLYLPKCGKILLAGAYVLGNGHSYMYGDVYRSLPIETWLYDTQQNEWSLLPLTGSPPTRSSAVQCPMAANENDSVVYLAPSGRMGSATWACKIDPSQVDADATAKRGVAPETVAFRGDEDEPKKGSHSYDPAFWDQSPKPDRAAAAARYDALPANQWIQVVPPKPVDVRGWGTSAYDADRQQILYWGGGHSEYKGTDVSHYSLRTGLWSGSFRPEWVLEASSDFLLHTLVSFHDRPHIPVHAYQTYAIDPPSGLMVAVKDAFGGKSTVTFVYDPAARQWEPQMLQTPFSGAVMHVIVRSTPGGAIAWAEEGLFRFDGKSRAWNPLPIHGGKFSKAPWCDGSAMIYDPNRDCLWLSALGDLNRYDLKTGELQPIPLKPPALLGEFPFWREAVFLPHDDLILVAKLFKNPKEPPGDVAPAGGNIPTAAPAIANQDRWRNVAYDVRSNKWYWVNLPFISESDGKPTTFKENPFSWSSAIFYDAGRNAVILHHPVNFWLLHFDRKAAKMMEMDQ